MTHPFFECDERCPTGDAHKCNLERGHEGRHAAEVGGSSMCTWTDQTTTPDLRPVTDEDLAREKVELDLELRDQVAMRMLAALASTSGLPGDEGSDRSLRDRRVRAAFDYADVYIAERAKRRGGS